MSYRSCPECGARLATGARRCDLCGASLEAQNVDPEPNADERGPVGAGRSSGGAPEDDGSDASVPGETDSGEVFCNACGAANAAGSNYCSQCGEPLRRSAPRPSAVPAPPSAVPASPAEARRSEPTTASADDAEGRSALTQKVGVLIGLAVLVVVALYMITVVSKQRAPAGSESIASAPAETRSASIIREREAVPISENFRDRVDSLRSVIDGADPAESVQARRQLVDFLIGIGRIDRAAIEQQRVARITDEAPDWKKAGNLLFDWMEATEPDSKSRVALLAIDAYKQVLQQRPDDLDARADLGWVYQYDPQNPMEAIRHTNLVLEENPEHLTANYNKGVFLMRINRIDDALKQFERVKVIAGADSPYYRQSEMWIDTIRESRERGEAR